jgi:hypothetical protein
MNMQALHARGELRLTSDASSIEQWELHREADSSLASQEAGTPRSACIYKES